MYDFKHTTDLNAYETYTKTVEKNNALRRVRNILFLIALLVLIFMAGSITLKNYKEGNLFLTQKNLYHNNIEKIHMDNEISHIQISKAITESLIKNFQSQRVIQKMDDDELKNIIQKVVNKIEEQPITTKYSQN